LARVGESEWGVATPLMPPVSSVSLQGRGAERRGSAKARETATPRAGPATPSPGRPGPTDSFGVCCLPDPQSSESSERRLMLIVPWKHVWSGACVQLITLYSACARAPVSDPSTTRPLSTAVPDWLS